MSWNYTLIRYETVLCIKNSYFNVINTTKIINLQNVYCRFNVRFGQNIKTQAVTKNGLKKTNL